MSLPVNAAHWHLVLNHMPIFLVAIGIGVLVAGWWRDSFELKVTSLILFFLAGAVVVPVAWSGEQAEHLVEDYGGISNKYMERHEEAGAQAVTWSWHWVWWLWWGSASPGGRNACLTGSLA